MSPKTDAVRSLLLLAAFLELPRSCPAAQCPSKGEKRID